MKPAMLLSCEVVRYLFEFLTLRQRPRQHLFQDLTKRFPFRLEFSTGFIKRCGFIDPFWDLGFNLPLNLYDDISIHVFGLLPFPVDQ